MIWASLFVPILFTVIWRIGQVGGHGMLMDPVNRGSAWRLGFDTPINYDDSGNFCGGFSVHYIQNKGKCGPCGDNYADPRPRHNENGGKYGRGVIVRNYTMEQQIIMDVLITANHMGHFDFSICPLKSEDEMETNECFKEYPIQLEDGSYKYDIAKGYVGHYQVIGYLPKGLTCERCVLRWQYTAGNNWGICEDGSGRLGCGNQETFRTCSDVAIDYEDEHYNSV